MLSAPSLTLTDRNEVIRRSVHAPPARSRLSCLKPPPAAAVPHTITETHRHAPAGSFSLNTGGRGSAGVFIQAQDALQLDCGPCPGGVIDSIIDNIIIWERECWLIFKPAVSRQLMSRKRPIPCWLEFSNAETVNWVPATKSSRALPGYKDTRFVVTTGVITPPQ
jgi:hypothetical protein